MTLAVSLALAVIAPGLSVLLVGLVILGRGRVLSEPATSTSAQLGLAVSLVANLVAAAVGFRAHGEVDYGAWIAVGGYEVPAVLLVDEVSLAFSVLASGATLVIARFSRTYLHKEPGYTRYFLLLGLFATGTQLVAHAGALDVFFAGWELIGISSALYIGFYYERDEPVRSSVRAFATYRLCDVGFMIGVVTTHELIGSTQLADLHLTAALPAWQSFGLAAMFLLAAMGKSAQLPFSGWLARAMEGPTPSSALFYGGISIHAGLFLLLRIRPLLAAAPVVEAFGVLIGLATAVYAAQVTRTHSDAKGALAHATLAQVGLILAEICLGLDTLALVHLVGHAVLRLYQYLRAPNRLHDAHRLGPVRSPPGRTSDLALRVYASALHRLRLDERLDQLSAPVWWLARAVDRADRRLRAATSLDGPDGR